MHLAKGLEFRGVAVIACDDDVLPLQERIETVTDQSDLEEVYNTERHLLYVACTRARDRLLITGVAPASEFLADLAPLKRRLSANETDRPRCRDHVCSDRNCEINYLWVTSGQLLLVTHPIFC
jgi:superfamily I DNA/RNA helicase